MLVTPKVAATIAQRSGIRRSMLLMAARSATMWLSATMTTLYLSEHCQRGWTRHLAECCCTVQFMALYRVALPLSMPTSPTVTVSSLPARQLVNPLARWWTVCDESSDDYQTFNISLGEHQLLEPRKDLCCLVDDDLSFHSIHIE